MLKAVGKVFDAVLTPILQTLGLTSRPMDKPMAFQAMPGDTHQVWIQANGPVVEPVFPSKPK